MDREKRRGIVRQTTGGCSSNGRRRRRIDKIQSSRPQSPNRLLTLIRNCLARYILIITIIIYHYYDLYKLSGEASRLSSKTLIRRQESGCTVQCLLHLAVYKQRESQYLTFHSPVTQFIFSLNPQNQNLHKKFCSCEAPLTAGRFEVEQGQDCGLLGCGLIITYQITRRHIPEHRILQHSPVLRASNFSGRASTPFCTYLGTPSQLGGPCQTVARTGKQTDFYKDIETQLSSP